MRARLERLGFIPPLVVVFTLLLLPVVIVVVTSLTTQQSPAIPYDGLTLEWYVELTQDRQIVSAIQTSVVVGVFASVLAGIMGTVTAFGLVRSEIRFKESLATVMLLPIMISPVIIGIAILRFGSSIGVPTGYPMIILAHSVLTFPFVFLIVRARLLTFDAPARGRLADARRERTRDGVQRDAADRRAVDRRRNAAGVRDLVRRVHRDAVSHRRRDGYGSDLHLHADPDRIEPRDQRTGDRARRTDDRYELPRRPDHLIQPGTPGRFIFGVSNTPLILSPRSDGVSRTQ